MSGRVLPISGGACVILALMLLTMPLKWLVSAILAAAFHELCHAIAVWLCGGRILDFRIDFHGALMTVSNMSYGKELICALAGPLGGFLLLFVARWFPRIALCAFVQSMYNLLPIFPLDGGRMVYNVIHLMFSPKNADNICVLVQKISMALLGVTTVVMSFIWNLGIVPLLFGFFLLIRIKFGKIPCKVGVQRVQ